LPGFLFCPPGGALLAMRPTLHAGRDLPRGSCSRTAPDQPSHTRRRCTLLSARSSDLRC
jgi:hypothetical protein